MAAHPSFSVSDYFHTIDQYGANGISSEMSHGYDNTNAIIQTQTQHNSETLGQTQQQNHSVFPAQYYSASSNYLNSSAANYTHLAAACQYPYAGSAGYLAGQTGAPQTSSLADQYDYYADPRAQNPAELGELQNHNHQQQQQQQLEQRALSPGHYYQPLPQVAATNGYQQALPGDYQQQQFNVSQCYQLETLASQLPAQIIAATPPGSSAALSLNAGGHPLYSVANFNLDYSTQVFESAGEQQPQVANSQSNGCNQARSKVGSRSLQAFQVAEKAARKTGFAGSETHRNEAQTGASKNNVSNNNNTSSALSYAQLAPLKESSISSSVTNKMELLKRRHTQLVSQSQLQSQNHSNSNNANANTNTLNSAANKQNLINAASSTSSASTLSLGIISRRKNATRETTSTLKDWLDEHSQNPYPTKGEKIMLSIITKMSLTQVSTWFANARRRMKKESKVFWSSSNSALGSGSGSTGANNNNSNNNNSNGAPTVAASIAKPASSIRYFIHKHRKQLAGAGSMLALGGANGNAEHRYDMARPVVYCAPANQVSCASDDLKNRNQRASGLTCPKVQVGSSAWSAPSPAQSSASCAASSYGSSSNSSCLSAKNNSQRSSEALESPTAHISSSAPKPTVATTTTGSGENNKPTDR